MIEDIDNNY